MGATQPDGAAGEDVEAEVTPPLGATQSLGACALGAGVVAVPGVVVAAVALAGVDCSCASNDGDAAPVTDSEWDCWKLEIAARVLGPM